MALSQKDYAGRTRGEWTSVILPRSGWFDIDLAELWRYRDLIALFVRRDFVATYKQTVLGPLWFFLQPLFSTIVFSVVFGSIAGISTDGLPHVLFYMAGIITWSYFGNCLNRISTTFTANAGMFGKVYFPRLTVPIAVVINNLLTFAIQFGLFLALLLVYFLKGAPVRPNSLLLLLPLLLLQTAALALGVGMLVASATTRYRDLGFFMGFGVQLWMYATPIVYPMSRVPAEWQGLYALNPMAPVVELFRYAFLGTGSFRPWNLAVSAALTMALLFGGAILFSRTEKTFLDTV